MPHPAAAEMAPTGKLRVAINMRNALLVTGKTESGDPEGLAPSMAAAIAERLEVPVQYIPYNSPGDLADAAAEDVWDVALIGADPDRAAYVTFTDPYCEIEATYLVPEDSKFQTNDEVDAKDVRIAVCAKAAYDLWLERNIRHASVHRADGHEATYELFKKEKMEALAGLRSKLSADLAQLPGTRMLPGKFMAVEQAACTKKGRDKGFKMLSEFIEEAKASGLVLQLMEKFGVASKLSVAPPAKKAAGTGEVTPAVDPAPAGAMEMKVTAKNKTVAFYARTAAGFLRGLEAKPAEGSSEAQEAKAPVDDLRISALGDAINVAGAVAAKVQSDGLGEIRRVQTCYPTMESSGRGCAQILIDIKRTG